MKGTLGLILVALALTATESYAEQHAPRQRQAAPPVRTKPATPPAATSQSAKNQRTAKPATNQVGQGGETKSAAFSDDWADEGVNATQRPQPRTLTDDVGGVTLNRAESNASKPPQSPPAAKWEGPDFDAAKSAQRSPQPSDQARGSRPNNLKGVDREVTDYDAAKQAPPAPGVIVGNKIGTDGAKSTPPAPETARTK